MDMKLDIDNIFINSMICLINRLYLECDFFTIIYLIFHDVDEWSI